MMADIEMNMVPDMEIDMVADTVATKVFLDQFFLSRILPWFVHLLLGLKPCGFIHSILFRDPK